MKSKPACRSSFNSGNRSIENVGELVLREPTFKELAKLRAAADYQFDKGVGRVLFSDEVRVTRSKGRMRQVWLGDRPLCTIRASDGFIVPNRLGAELLHQALKPPRLRVVVGADAAPFVAQGKTVFAKHVVGADPEIRPAEEVLVVDPNDRLLASGKALLAGEEMIAFKTGKAVQVRRGFGGKKPEGETTGERV